MTGRPSVVDNEASRRFELSIDGHLATLAYRREPARLVLIHTDVPDELRGRGVGGALVTAAINHAAEQHVAVTSTCSFVSAWLDRQPNVASTVTIVEPLRPEHELAHHSHSLL